MTWHLAFNPQDPGQGSIHFWLTHAFVRLHSELITHSGLHVGGLPIKPGTQEHTACPFICLHWLLGPQGDGLHGSCIGGNATRKIMKFLRCEICFWLYLQFCCIV